MSLSRLGIFRHAFWRFCVVGSIGFVVDAGFTWGWLRLGWHPLAARAAAVLIAMSITWIINRRFTFGMTKPASVKEWATYMMVNSTGAMLNYGLYSLCILIGLHWFLSLCIGSGIALISNFLANRRITFREQS